MTKTPRTWKLNRTERTSATSIRILLDLLDVELIPTAMHAILDVEVGAKRGPSISVTFIDNARHAGRALAHHLAALVLDTLGDLDKAGDGRLYAAVPMVDHAFVVVDGPEGVLAVAPFFEGAADAIVDAALEVR